jgi:predicted nucleic acid-binding protein
VHQRVVSLLIALVSLPALTLVASARVQNREADAAVKKFLASQKTNEEEAEAAGSAVADLDGDGKPEIVLVWTTLGATYWHNSLTVLSKTAGDYKPVATYALNGEAQLSKVSGGVIYVDQKLYAKRDPTCCPSVKRMMKYRLTGKKIAEVKR